jgi:hypothetical protein
MGRCIIMRVHVCRPSRNASHRSPLSPADPARHRNREGRQSRQSRQPVGSAMASLAHWPHPSPGKTRRREALPADPADPDLQGEHRAIEPRKTLTGISSSISSSSSRSGSIRRGRSSDAALLGSCAWALKVRSVCVCI